MGRTTSYGTGSYATKQAVDTTAANQAINNLIRLQSAFVAINDNKSAYSPDGINWYTTTTISDGSWESMAFGNGKCVAVSQGGMTAYSTNGINWTTAGLVGNWFGVTYGNGKFVAVGFAGKIAYSTNGINWTTKTLTGTGNWYGVTYGNGKFVAVGSNITGYSTDGINWTTKTLAGSWTAVTYGDKFAAVSYDMTGYSTDGINWTTKTLNSAWTAITYPNNLGLYIAVGYGEKNAYSVDAITWYTKDFPDYYWYGIASGAGRVVIVGAHQTSYSYNGGSWETPTTLMAAWSAIAYCGPFT
jgi:hypothetical protein